ncbi:unnamed protein product [Pseudo-nitzschia multistriata]|uniref:Uncharacterized protein n=1 Tax=Pseudo-nitzschia multistriata TaxID=183589 RepID=A0A448ZC31_9STRA|nr:unnamed protein product [Pseudo-nitzschia multistriata]
MLCFGACCVVPCALQQTNPLEARDCIKRLGHGSECRASSVVEGSGTRSTSSSNGWDGGSLGNGRDRWGGGKTVRGSRVNGTETLAYTVEIRPWWTPLLNPHFQRILLLFVPT